MFVIERKRVRDREDIENAEKHQNCNSIPPPKVSKQKEKREKRIIETEKEKMQGREKEENQAKVPE